MRDSVFTQTTPPPFAGRGCCAAAGLFAGVVLAEALAGVVADESAGALAGVSAGAPGFLGLALSFGVLWSGLA